MTIVETILAEADACLAATGEQTWQMRHFMDAFERLGEAVLAGEADWADARPWALRRSERLMKARPALGEWEDFLWRFSHRGEEEIERALTMRSQRAVASVLFRGTPAGDLLAAADEEREDEELHEMAEAIGIDPPDWVPESHRWWRWTDLRLERPVSTEVSIEPGPAALPPDGPLPLTRHRWLDLVQLFEEGAANKNCWCSYWRMLSWKERDAGRDNGENRRMLRQAVARGTVPGLLLYERGRPIGWCSVAPRAHFPYLETCDRSLPRLDDADAWSVNCLYVPWERRGEGITVRLLRAAAEYAGRQGAEVIEGYPLAPGTRATYRQAHVGWTSAFLAAGYTEAGRGDTGRVVMRRVPAR
jgi:GNAT superfamily N-acetyltransferase